MVHKGAKDFVIFMAAFFRFSLQDGVSQEVYYQDHNKLHIFKLQEGE